MPSESKLKNVNRRKQSEKQKGNVVRGVDKTTNIRREDSIQIVRINQSISAHDRGRHLQQKERIKTTQTQQQQQHHQKPTKKMPFNLKNARIQCDINVYCTRKPMCNLITKRPNIQRANGRCWWHCERLHTLIHLLIHLSPYYRYYHQKRLQN